MAAYIRLYHSGGGTVVASAISHAQKTECLKINPVFLPVKFIYFFFSGAMVSMMPYMPVFMSFLGLTTFQTGIARGTEPLIHMLVGPIWGSISDKYSKHKTIVIMALVLPAAFYFSTQFVPPVKVTMPWIEVNKSVTVPMGEQSEIDTFMQTKADSHVEIFEVTELQWKLNGSLKHDLEGASKQVSENPTASTATTTAAKTKTDSTSTFLLMVLLVFCGRLFMSPFNPIFDSTVVRMTKEHTGGDYGKQRMFAAIGSGTFSMISGAAIDAFGRNPSHSNKYTPMFYMYAGMLILVLIPVSVMKFPSHSRPQAIYRNVGVLFLKLEFVMFLLAAFTSGFSLGAINTFLFIFVAELDGPHILMGFSLSVTCVSTATCMFFSKKIIHKLGHKNVFNVVVFCYAVRHLAYSTIQNPWLVLPVGLLHGICFGAFWPTCTSYVNLIAPEGLEASVQSIAHSTYFGLGRGLGMVIGGVIYGKFGARNLFRSIAVFCIVVLVVLGLAQCYTARTQRRQGRLSVQYDEI